MKSFETNWRCLWLRSVQACVVVLFSVVSGEQHVEASSLRYIGPEESPSHSRVISPCVDKPAKICVEWTLRMSEADGLQVTRVAAFSNLVTKVLTAWSTDFFKFSIKEMLAVHSEFDGEAGESLEGFSISLVPPDADFVTSGRSFQLSEKFSEDKRQTLAGRIFLKNADDLVSMERALAYAVGRLFGLGSSIERQSLMSENFNQPMSATLSAIDLMWLSSIYSPDPERGVLRGRVFNGATQKPLRGVSVYALRSSHAENFIASQDRSLVDRHTYTGPDGTFFLPQVPEGSYYIIIESRVAFPLSIGAFDSWLGGDEQSLGFETEFYDGLERESNSELAHSFSPQALGYAALLPVVGGTSVNGITIITNLVKPEDTALVTSPASQEVLAKTFPEPKNIKAQVFEPLPSLSSGGCSMGVIERPLNWGMITFYFFIALMGLKAIRASSRKNP